MRCPKCKQADLESSGECAQCGFHGENASLEELSHLNWLLDEIGKWAGLGISPNIVNQFRKYYSERQKKAQVTLGLRPPPFLPSEARDGWIEYLQHEALFERIRIWRVAGQVNSAALSSYTARSGELRLRLEGYNRPETPQTRRERLDVVNFILAAIPVLKQAEAFNSPEAEQKVSAALQTEKENLETLLGLRAAPAPLPSPTTLSSPRLPRSSAANGGTRGA